jgi:alkaline phosphatase/CRP-like cAMP-binding protein/HEAT repeat protein
MVRAQSFFMRALAIRSGEGRRLVFLYMLAFLINVCVVWGQTASDAIFLSKFGVKSLPLMFIGDAVLTALISILYTNYIDRVSNSRLMILICLIGDAILSITYISIVYEPVITTIGLPDNQFAYYLLYLFQRVMKTLLSVHAWTFIADFYDTRMAKRHFPVIASAARTSGILAGLISVPIATFFDVTGLMLAWLVALLVCAGFVTVVMRNVKVGESAGAPRPAANIVSNFKEGWGHIKGSRFLGLLALGAVVSTIVLYLLEYQTQAVFVQIFNSPRQLATFYGVLSSISDLVTLPIQMFLLNRIVSWVGVGSANLIFPFLSLFSFFSVALLPGQISASFARINYNALRSVFRTPLDGLLYNAVSPEAKGRARAFINGILVPLGTMSAGVILILFAPDSTFNTKGDLRDALVSTHNYYLQLFDGKEAATDSASAATAMATGQKTKDGMIAVDPHGEPMNTIAEILKSNDFGFAVSVASSVPFSHATPASFIAHNISRENYTEIAHEIIFEGKPDVVVGGGFPDAYTPPVLSLEWFMSLSKSHGFISRDDYDALKEGRTVYTLVERQKGVNGGDSLMEAASKIQLDQGQKLFGLYGGEQAEFLPANRLAKLSVSGHMGYYDVSDTPNNPLVTVSPTLEENPQLSETVQATLSVLSQDPEGFFVMFEQGDIDWSGHENNYRHLIGSVWDLDNAVKAAVDYVDQPGGPEWEDTLIIVTADHATGFLRLNKPLGMGDLPEQVEKDKDASRSKTLGDWEYPNGEVSFSTIYHSNELVDLYARGAGSKLFEPYVGLSYPGEQIMNNTAIHDVMLDAARQKVANHIILFIGDGMGVNHEIATSRYLYGKDDGLSWQGWDELENGFHTYVSTWDVTAYNKYANLVGAPLYDPKTFDPYLGYDPALGGSVPNPISTVDPAPEPPKVMPWDEPRQRVIILLGLTVALAYVVTAINVRRNYGQALLSVLEHTSLNTMTSESLPDTEELTVVDSATLQWLGRKLDESQTDDSKLFVARLICEMGGSDGVPLLDKTARSSSPYVRAMILNLLTSENIAGGAVEKLYADYLNDPNPAVRAAALSGLAELMGTQSTVFLNIALEKLPEQDLRGQPRMLSILLSSHDPKYHAPARAKLNELLASADDERRVAGVRTARQITNQTFQYEILLTCLRDNTDSVRQEAALALEELLPRAPADIQLKLTQEARQSLIHDPLEQVRRLAVAVFQREKTSDAYSKLVAMLYDENKEIRQLAAAALVSHGKVVAPYLLPLVDAGPQHKQIAITALYQIDPQHYADEIEQLVTQSVRSVYEYQFWLNSLKPIKSTHGVELLSQMLRERIRARQDGMVEILKVWRGAQSTALIVQQLNSVQLNSRENAAEALEALTSPQLANLLIEALLPDMNPANLTRLAGEVFGLTPLSWPETLQKALFVEDDPLLNAVTARTLLALLSLDPETPMPEPGMPPEDIKTLLENAVQENPNLDISLSAQAALVSSAEIPAKASQETTMLSSIERIIVLHEVRFFQGMSVDELKSLAAICDEQSFEPDQIIFNEGEPGGTLYVVVKGRVAIEKNNLRRRSVTRVATYEPGNYFGESTLFDATPRSASARALENTVTLSLSRGPLIALVRQNTDLGLSLMSVLSERLRDANNRIADLSRSRPTELDKLFDQMGS